MAWREQALRLRDCEDFREFTEKMLRSLFFSVVILSLHDILGCIVKRLCIVFIAVLPT